MASNLSSQNWLDAQYSVLGALLLDGSLVPKVLLEMQPGHFSGVCRTVYDAIRSIYQEGQTVDPVSVSHKLGPEYGDFLKQLMTVVPTTAGIDRYIEIAREQAATTTLQELGSRMAACESLTEMQALLDRANRAAIGKEQAKAVGMEDAFRLFMERQKTKPEYLEFPMASLNRQLFVEKGDYIIVGGEPSTGKTAFTLQLAAYFSQKKKVGFFSLETSVEKLTDRLASVIFGASMAEIKNRNLSNQAWLSITGNHRRMTSCHLEFVQAAGWSPADIKAYTQLRGYDIIVIDYLQLLQAPGSGRTEQVTAISIALHTLAQSTGTIVFALSQLSRAEKGQKVRVMSDLRESGQIEQDADIIMLLAMAEAKKGDESGRIKKGDRDLMVVKNKEGVRGNLLIRFDGPRQRFTEVVDETPDMKRYREEKARKAAEKAAEEAKKAAEKETALQQLPMDTKVPF